MTQKPTRQTVCGAIAALLLSSCATGPRVIVSKFPSPDFRLVVEELADVDGVVQVQRRFRVLADGTCSYARASAQLVDPETGITLPVFSILSVYQLMGINVRLLARKLHKQQLGVLTQAEIGGVLDQSRRWRISYRAANTQSELVVGGQINRLLVGIFNVINNHVPPGEGFALQGLSGDPDPVSYSNIQAPVASVQGALGAYSGLLLARPAEADLLLETFALACTAKDRKFAAELLARFSALPPPSTPVPGVPTITAASLQGMLR